MTYLEDGGIGYTVAVSLAAVRREQIEQDLCDETTQPTSELFVWGVVARSSQILCSSSPRPAKIPLCRVSIPRLVSIGERCCSSESSVSANNFIAAAADSEASNDALGKLRRSIDK
jgi:hypothetical protein